MLLRREFSFDAAHNLVEYHGKCERLHGHTYTLAVEIEGTPNREGMIVDFIEVRRIVDDEIISKFDHSYLNDIVPQPSAENLARWVFERLDPLLRGPNYALRAVQLWESPRSSVIFGREDLEPKIEAVLFDFDMTLVDSSYVITDCTNKLADMYGLRRITREELMTVIGLPLAEAWERQWGRVEPEWLDTYRAKFRDAEQEGMREYPGARVVPAALRAAGIRTGVVSNRTYARLAVDKAGMSDLFDVVVGFENVTKPKPDAEPVLHALAQIGVRPWNAVYVGDTDVDMMTAVNAGVRGIGVTTGNFGGEDLRAAGAEWVCGALEEIPAIIGIAGR
jgi:queuosine biosynthesis protein QueD